MRYPSRSPRPLNPQRPSNQRPRLNQNLQPPLARKNQNENSSTPTSKPDRAASFMPSPAKIKAAHGIPQPYAARPPRNATKWAGSSPSTTTASPAPNAAAHCLPTVSVIFQALSEIAQRFKLKRDQTCWVLMWSFSSNYREALTNKLLTPPCSV